MFTEDLIAEFAINILRFFVIVISGIFAAKRIRQIGRFDFVPLVVALVISIMLGIAQPYLADFIYTSFLR